LKACPGGGYALPRSPGSSDSLESTAFTAPVDYHTALKQQRSRSGSFTPLPKHIMGIFGANFVLKEVIRSVFQAESKQYFTMLHLPQVDLGKHVPGKPRQYFIVLLLACHYVSHRKWDPESSSSSLEQNSAAPFRNNTSALHLRSA